MSAEAALQAETSARRVSTRAPLALFVGVVGGEERLGAQPMLGATKPGLWSRHTVPWFLDPTPML